MCIIVFMCVCVCFLFHFVFCAVLVLVLQAHALASEIAAAITAENPPPVMIKVEKVRSSSIFTFVTLSLFIC